MPSADPQSMRVRLAQVLGTIEGAAVAGVLHAALLIVAIVLVGTFPRSAGDAELAAFFDDGAARARVLAALNLATLSIIAFLWFIAVVRRRIGTREDKFFATVFLGSGLLTAAAVLIGFALIAAPVLAADGGDAAPDLGAARTTRIAGIAVLSLIATRLGAVFILATSTLGGLTGALPRWLVVLGRVAAIVMMVNYLVAEPMPFLFPVWVAVASTALSVRSKRGSAPPDELGARTA